MAPPNTNDNAKVDELIARLKSEMAVESAPTSETESETPLERIGNIASAYGKGAVSGAVNFIPNVWNALSTVSEAVDPSFEAQIKREVERHNLGLGPWEYQLHRAKRAADVVGHGAFQAGGGLLGALGGTALEGGVPGPGTIVGAGIGAGGGEIAYQKLKDYILGNEQKTPEELAAQAGEAFAPGALMGIGKAPAIRTGVAEAPAKIGSALKENFLAHNLGNISLIGTVKSDQSAKGSFLLNTESVNGKKVHLPVRIFPSQKTTVYLDEKVELKGRAVASREVRAAALIFAEEIKTLRDPKPIFQISERIRSRFRSEASRIGGDAGALIPGLVIGDTKNESKTFTDQMRRVGLTHLTAVSGENFAIVAAFLAWLLQFFIPKLRLRLVITGLVLVLFIFLFARAEHNLR